MEQPWTTLREMATRKFIQDKTKAAQEKVSEWRTGQQEKNAPTSRVIDGAEKYSKLLYDQFKKGTGWVVSKSAERLGADQYRDELDKALQEALRVITVQEERIALLEAKLNERSDA